MIFILLDVTDSINNISKNIIDVIIISSSSSVSCISVVSKKILK